MTSRGALYSAILHICLFIVLVFGIHFNKRLPIEERVISVEVLPVSSISNVKKSAPRPEPKKKPEEPKPEPPKKAPEKPAPTPEPVKQDKLEEPAPKPKEEQKPEPVPVKETPKPEIQKPKEPEKPKEQPKKEEAKKEKKKEPKKEEDPFAAVLKTVEKIEKKQDKSESESKEEAPKSELAEGKYDPDKPLSLSEMDSIRQQVQPHWTILGGAKGAEDIVVVVHLTIEMDGTIRDAEIVDAGRYSSDPFFRAAADRALLAVKRTRKFNGLPTDRYATWKEMNMTFDPKDMF